MTPTQKKAMEMALEALTKIHASPVWPWCCEGEIAALRAALAEQPQHPIVFCEAPKCIGTAKTCTGPCSHIDR